MEVDQPHGRGDETAPDLAQLGLSATLVDEVNGVPYVQFVGTGMVATAVIFSSALPAMFGTFVKHRFQNTYDAILEIGRASCRERV